MEDKKKIALRMDDQELLAATVTRNDKDKLVVTVKVHPKIAEVMRGNGNTRTDENGREYYHRQGTDLEPLIQSCREQIGANYPAMGELTVALTQYSFIPDTLLLNGQLNFQVFRLKGLGDEKGVELEVNGAMTKKVMRAWLLVARAFTAAVWEEYMYPVAMEATLTTREMVS